MDTLAQSSASSAGNLQRSHAASLFAAVDRTQPHRSPGARLILWESDRTMGGDITPAQADTIAESVRRGGSLLLTLSANPQPSIMLLSKALPAIPWAAGANWTTDFGPRPSVRVSAVDPEIFPGTSFQGQQLPFFTAIRPFSAVERGQATYERYAQTIPYANLKVDPGSQFWSRSLLNRQWRVRASGDDVYASPLLVTGVYGAGRVAVFASSAASLDGWQGGGGQIGAEFWSNLLRWLAPSRPEASGGNSMDANGIALSAALTEPGVASISIVNSGATAVRGSLVTRALSAEGALLGASEAESETPVAIPAGGSRNVQVKLPLPSSTGYHSLDASQAVRLRMGLLTATNADLLAETEVALSFAPPVTVSLHTDNLYVWPYPFDAAACVDLPAMNARMGNRIGAYCYPPGATVQCEVVVANGVANLAAAASIVDETQVGNPSVMALNDGSATQEKGPGDGIQGYGAWVGVPNRENALRLTFPTPIHMTAITLVGCGVWFRLGLDHNPGAAIIEADGVQIASFPSIDQNFLDGYGRARLEIAPIQVTTLRLRLPWVPMRADRRRQIPWLGEIEVEGLTGRGTNTSGDLEVVLRDSLGGSTTIPVDHEQVQLMVGGRYRAVKSFALPQPSGSASATRFLTLEARFSGAGSGSGAGAAAQLPVMVIAPSRAIQSRGKLLTPNSPALTQLVTHGFRNCFALGTGTGEINVAWGSADDLIWAYSRQLKQETRYGATEANRLYVTSTDMRHYSTPWAVFPNGEEFYSAATPGLVARMSLDRYWAHSTVAILFHSDRWDSGPQMSGMHQWQEYVEFDRHLRATGGYWLAGPHQGGAGQRDPRPA